MTARNDMNGRMPDWLESAWLTRYLERGLSDAEVEWFETYLIDKPEIAARVDEDNDLRDAMASAPDAVAMRGGSVSEPVAERALPRGHRGIRRWLPLAAAIALGIGIGGFARLSPHPAPLDGNPTRMVFDTLRGEPMPPRVDHADSPSSQVLVEIAVPADATDIRLELGTMKGIALKPSSEGFVSFVVSREQLHRENAAVLHYRSGTGTHRQSLELNPRPSDAAGSMNR